MIEEIIKINGKLFNTYSKDLIVQSHKEHANAGNKIISIDFKKAVKDRILNEPDASVCQIYHQEQAKLVASTSMEIVAEVVPQLYNLQSGLA